MTTNNIMIGKVVLGGQNLANGHTMTITDLVATAGDVVGADMAIPNGAKRTADGTLPLGVLIQRERDGLGTVQNFTHVVAVRLTGAVTLGPCGMTCAGDGSVKLVPAGTAGSLHVNCFGSQVKDGATYAAITRV